MQTFISLAGPIKDITTAIAIVVGGIWTWYTFSALGTRSKAEAERFKQAIIEVTVQASQEVSTADTDVARTITAVATVENKGTRNTFFDFTKLEPFMVYKIEFDDKGIGNRQLIKKVETDGRGEMMRMGSISKFPAAFQVPSVGLYIIYFRVCLSPEELDLFHKSDQATLLDLSRDEKDLPVRWEGSTFLFVT